MSQMLNLCSIIRRTQDIGPKYKSRFDALLGNNSYQLDINVCKWLNEDDHFCANRSGDPCSMADIISVLLSEAFVTNLWKQVF